MVSPALREVLVGFRLSLRNRKDRVRFRLSSNYTLVGLRFCSNAFLLRFCVRRFDCCLVLHLLRLIR